MSYGMNNQSRLGASTGNIGRSNAIKSPTGVNVKQVPNFTPEQMQLFQSLFGQVGPESFTGRLAAGDESAFNQMEAPAYRDFSAQIGGLASRFSGMGDLGARRSGGFQREATAGASNFAQDLQSKRVALQRQAIQDLMGMSKDLLSQRPYETYFEEKKPSFLQQLLGGALPIAGAGIGGFFGGPAGAAIGGQIGSKASQGFFA